MTPSIAHVPEGHGWIGGVDTTRLLDELVRHTAAFADAVRAGDRSAVVPTCPDWTLTDLAHHLGEAQRWAAAMLTELPDHHLPLPEVCVPEGDDETSTWLLAGAGTVGEAHRACGDDAQLAGFVGSVPARFWARRMAHETLVHRFDAELAAGVDPWVGVDPAIAADAIDENLWLLATYGPSVRPQLAGQGETLHVHLTDVDGEWLITREPTGPRIEHTHRKADVAVRGSATGVLAVLTNRRAPGDGGTEVLGDSELLEHWRRTAAI